MSTMAMLGQIRTLERRVTALEEALTKQVLEEPAEGTTAPRFQPKHKGFKSENWWVIDVATGDDANGQALATREEAERLAAELNQVA